MPDWLATVLAAAVPGALVAAVAWGAMSARLRRVEADVSACVRREVHAEQQEAIKERLGRVESNTARILDRLTGYTRTPRPDDEDSGSHRVR